LALAKDLPRVWSASTTTAADGKQLLRLLIDRVLLDNHRQVGRTWFQINWRTGATTEHWPVRRVRGHFDYAGLDELKCRSVSYTPCSWWMRRSQTPSMTKAFARRTASTLVGRWFHLLRKRWGLPTWNPTTLNPPQWPDGTYSVAAAAELLDVYPGTICLWLRRRVLSGRQLRNGARPGTSTCLNVKLLASERDSLAHNVPSIRGDRHHDRFGDTAAAGALLDSFLHHADISIRLQGRVGEFTIDSDAALQTSPTEQHQSRKLHTRPAPQWPPLTCSPIALMGIWWQSSCRIAPAKSSASLGKLAVVGDERGKGHLRDYVIRGKRTRKAEEQFGLVGGQQGLTANTGKPGRAAAGKERRHHGKQREPQGGDGEGVNQQRMKISGHWPSR
jgi:hypothetical protein